MNDNRIPKNNSLLENARRLRREMTKQERHLWYDFLRYYPVKIYKQRIIGNYIADFYCASAKLVIEVDGNQHGSEEGMRADRVRDEYMFSLGLMTLRLPNAWIDRNFGEVCDNIDRLIRERMNYDQL